MTENEVERIFRDSRINLIVEGANEVMQSYIFGYGGKQLAEYMLGRQERPAGTDDGSGRLPTQGAHQELDQPQDHEGRDPAGPRDLPGHPSQAPHSRSVDKSCAMRRRTPVRAVREHSYPVQGR
jgi:acyl-CoA dehydrogenase family protein 9